MKLDTNSLIPSEKKPTFLSLSLSIDFAKFDGNSSVHGRSKSSWACPQWSLLGEKWSKRAVKSQFEKCSSLEHTVNTQRCIDRFIPFFVLHRSHSYCSAILAGMKNFSIKLQWMFGYSHTWQRTTEWRHRSFQKMWNVFSWANRNLRYLKTLKNICVVYDGGNNQIDYLYSIVSVCVWVCVCFLWLVIECFIYIFGKIDTDVAQSE